MNINLAPRRTTRSAPIGGAVIGSSFPLVLVDMNDEWLKGRWSCSIQFGVGEDDDVVTGLDQARGSTVNTDDSTAFISAD
jgi:hypothetical protein